MPPRSDPAVPSWTFLSNHALVLVCVAADPGIRMRDIAGRVGITERGVHRIVKELEAGGYLTAVRDGRRKRYLVHADRPLRHPLTAHRTVRQLVELGAGGRPKK